MSDGPDYFSFGVSDQDREELEDTMFSDNIIEVRDKAQEQLNIVLQDLPKDQVSEQALWDNSQLVDFVNQLSVEDMGGQPEC